jgi:hypothetical protein
VLTGMEAGERDVAGVFPPDSVHAAVEAQLAEWFVAWSALNNRLRAPFDDAGADGRG